MKRQKWIILIIAAVLLTSVLTGCSWNQNLLNGMHSKFERLIRQNSEFKMLDSVKEYGKLNGNGNGFDYFGAVLVELDSPEQESELKTLCESVLGQHYFIADYFRQTGQLLETRHVQHARLEYKYNVTEDKLFYTIFFLTNSKFTNWFDLKGYCVPA